MKAGLLYLPRVATIAGALLATVAIAFVVVELVRTGAFASPVWSSPNVWWIIVSLAALYTAILVLPVAAWLALVRGSSDVRVKGSAGFRIFALFQILKYIPSNLAHIGGRYAMLRQVGVDHPAIIWSTVAEAGLMAGTALAVAAIFGWSYLRAALESAEISRLWLLVGAILAIALGLGYASMRIQRVREAMRRLLSRQAWKATMAASAIFCGFFILSGVIFHALARSLDSHGAPPIGLSIATICIAWVLGFLAPGAPAGIGIREAVIVMLLGNQAAGVGSAAVLATAYRVITVLGDVLFATSIYFVAYIGKRYQRAVN